MGALSAALYGGGPDEILRGALIGGVSGGAFYGVGSAGIQSKALASGAHGVVGGLNSVAQGGDFKSGFLSAAVTKFSGSYVDPNGGQAYQIASAAAIGGVASEVGGGSFENGAITGAFSRLFNDLAEEHREQQVNRAPASGSHYMEGSGCVGATAGIGFSVCGSSPSGPLDYQVSFGTVDLVPYSPTMGGTVSFGPSGYTLGGQAGFQAGYGLTSITAGFEINFSKPIDTNFSMGVKVGLAAPQIKTYPFREIRDSLCII
jgi:hypothetical protein